MSIRIPSAPFASTLACLGLCLGLASGAAAQTTDVQAQIDALNARIAKLEGGALVDADVVGSYALFGIQSEMHGAGTSLQVRSYVYRGKLTLKADGKFTLSNVETGNQLDVNSTTGSSVSFFSTPEPLSRGSWKVVGNQLVSPQMPRLNIAAGGQIMSGTTANPADNTNVLLVLTRLP